VKRYDPDHSPNPEQWLALDEQTRIRLAEEHHRAAKIKLPNLKAHAVFHAIIENQIAENTEPVIRAMARLSTEGLSRHDAIHAIASVLAEHIHELLNAKEDQASSVAIYNAAVERLTARRWRGG
jgi:alpha-beta hydrolase superfamily lysophospholipase